MSEDFLHYVWKYKLYNQKTYELPTGEILELLHPGEHNSNAGPDFVNTRVKIGAAEWAGCCELHLKASDWVKHAHDTNAAYNNVVLHAVYHKDTEVFNANGLKLNTVEIKFNPNLEKNYLKLEKSSEAIACSFAIKNIDKFHILQWITTLAIERLETRSNSIIAYLNNNKLNWEEAFYQYLAKGFGLNVNALPFELLAQSLPLSIIHKHSDKLFQIEALLLGQSGLIPTGEHENGYVQNLQNEYAFLKNKYGLKPLQESIWKFMRIRPANFPTLRIAQLAALLANSQLLFRAIIEAETIADLKLFFEAKPSMYWHNHYHFNSQTQTEHTKISLEQVNLLIINVIIPFTFVYGKLKGNTHYQDKALQWLENIAPEKNSIVELWKQLGIKPISAFESQALLQLRNEYCNFKRCIKCKIGSIIINQNEA
jgi:hypothetical protein